MEPSSSKAKITHIFRDFAARYVSVIFAWRTIVYGTIFSMLALVPAEFFYYEWVTDSAMGIHTSKRANIVITEKEIESARSRIEGMEGEYEAAKNTQFDLTEPRATIAPTSPHVATSTASTTTATSSKK